MTLLDELGFPDVETVLFQRTPLRLALCQVRFRTVLGIADPKFVAPFQRALADRYPVTTPVGQIEFEITPGEGSPEVHPIQRGSQWRFTDEDENWSVVLTHEFVALETRSYDSFADFLQRLADVLRALDRHIRPIVVTRVGLRYVNEVRLGGALTREAAISSNLLGPQSHPAMSGDLEQSMQQMVLRYGGIDTVALRHGLFPRGTTVQTRADENAPEEPFYLLDFDAYREFTTTLARQFEANFVCDLVETYNKAIHRIFKWCVTPEYITSLGVR